MSASLDVIQSAMRPELYWLHVDDQLEAINQAPASWTELERLYRAGISVKQAVRCVIAGRKVKP